MKTRFTEHILSLVFVTVVMLAALFLVNHSKKAADQNKTARISDYISLPGADLTDPFQKALLKDAINIYFPDQEEKNDSLLQEVLRYKENQVRKNLESYPDEALSWSRLVQILGMYVKFLFIYLLVMGLTYYGVQTLGVWRFVRKKRRAGDDTAAPLRDPLLFLKKAAREVGKSAVYLIFFSPSYVIAYSIRTEFSTDSLFFMILLGVISNGLLVTYANKFYDFLITESRKGYVETARVKNLSERYGPDEKGGIPYAAIFRLSKVFDGHVFGHIFANARYQYISTIKEQAAFLITGLIIIEMALNIHGHFSYEMLRQMLYRNYDIVIVFFLGIFYTVKLTEMLADRIYQRETLKYENK